MGIFSGARILMGIFFLIFIVVFVFVVSVFVSPKVRSKMMGRQLKMQKKMLEDNKEVIQDLQELSGGIGIKATRGIIDENEVDLRHISGKSADINKDAVKTTVSAIKEGLTGESNIYCKHCGASIDSDSTFCKACGKKQ